MYAESCRWGMRTAADWSRRYPRSCPRFTRMPIVVFGDQWNTLINDLVTNSEITQSYELACSAICQSLCRALRGCQEAAIKNRHAVEINRQLCGSCTARGEHRCSLPRAGKIARDKALGTTEGEPREEPRRLPCTGRSRLRPDLSEWLISQRITRVLLSHCQLR